MILVNIYESTTEHLRAPQAERREHQWRSQHVLPSKGTWVTPPNSTDKSEHDPWHHHTQEEEEAPGGNPYTELIMASPALCVLVRVLLSRLQEGVAGREQWKKQRFCPRVQCPNTITASPPCHVGRQSFWIAPCGLGNPTLDIPQAVTDSCHLSHSKIISPSALTEP